MSASDKLNQIAKIKRSQATKERVAFGHALASAEWETRDERDALISIAIKANKLRACASVVWLREFLSTGQSKMTNALLCKLPFLCEVCAVRRQAKLFAAAVPKVDFVMREDPGLVPVMITRTIKSGPDLRRQADHFRSSREKMRKAVNRSKSSKSNNKRHWEMGKVLGQIRAFEVKKAKGNEDHWHFHEHIFGLIHEWIDVEKLSAEWREVTGDSFVVHVQKCEAKPGVEGSTPANSGLVEVIKYPLKFAGLRACDAWHAYSVLSGSRMAECLGLLRGVKVGHLEEDEPLEDESGPYVDFVCHWLESRESYRISTVAAYGEAMTKGNPYAAR